MADLNPYESPRIDADVAPLPYGKSPGLWRDGPLLIVQRGAAFPNRCVKTNEPAVHVLKREFGLTWTIDLPVSDRALARRSAFIALGWAFGAIGIVGSCVLPMAIFRVVGPSYWVATTWGALLALWGPIAAMSMIAVASMAVAKSAAAVVGLVKAEPEILVLSRVYPAYLAVLPPWPPQDELSPGRVDADASS